MLKKSSQILTEGESILNNIEITVNDILKKDSFKNVKIVSGEKGLNNLVKWTHIIESKVFINYLNGGELILTTGIGLASHPYAKISFIEKLINKNVAAICIELGNKFRSISPEIINLSNENNIPIIVFPGIVKFVDITHEVHKFILSRHYQTLNRLYNLSKRFNALSLLPNGILKILHELHANFKTPVFLIQHKSTSFYYPPNVKEMETKIRQSLHEKTQSSKKIVIDGKYYILSTVKNTNRITGYLCLEIKKHQNNDFLYTVLDHASLAISQITLRNEIADERKQYSEDEMVQEFLQGKYTDIDKLDTLLPFSYKNAFYRVIVLTHNRHHNNWHDWNEAKLRISFAIRNLYKQHNLFPVISIRENEISVISFTTKNNPLESKSLYENIPKLISNNKEIQKILNDDFDIGIGKSYNNIKKILQSYTEAKRVIELRNYNIINVLLYEDIGIYDVLFQINGREQIESFIQTHLGNILQLEEKTRNELLNTLEVFLDNNGSLKEASQKLYMVRQTLYHRINKLEEIIGKDFMEPPNRLPLEFAIKAHRYLSIIQ